LTTEHPDHEQLAAFEAGDGDRRQRAAVEAHLAGCPSCAELVASVERARDRLALLEEPDLPPGLHDRLAAAVEAEVAREVEAAGPAADRPIARLRRPAVRSAADGPASPAGAGRQAGGRAGGRERPVPWYRRPVAWGAAAALLLAALVAVPLLDRSTELSTASGGAGGGQAAQEAGGDAAAGGAGTLPVLRIPGEVTAAAIRARLATDYRARLALEGTPLSPSETRPAAPVQPQQGADSTSEGLRSSAPGSASVQGCLVSATAAADPAIRPLHPAFYVEGTYKGRQATVLVTTSTTPSGRADLWIFPRNDCSSAPLATERLR
jgi:anti-sigma factor RsiW